MKFKNYYYLENIEQFSDMLKGDMGTKGTKGFQGQTGDVGLRGLKGSIGPEGVKGQIGIQGVRGNRGDIGDPGKIGNPGKEGVKGVKGVVGPTGNKGPRGKRGVRGDIGLRGKKGDKGPKGPDGPTGDSGFQFSRFGIDGPGNSCDWIEVPQDMKAEMTNGRCPDNKAMNGLRSSRWRSKIQTTTKVETCNKKGCKSKWPINHKLTTWQYNRKYEMCCITMPFSNKTANLKEGKERLDPGWGYDNNRTSSLPKYPFHAPD
jgi:hypothetical protein